MRLSPKLTLGEPAHKLQDSGGNRALHAPTPIPSFPTAMFRPNLFRHPVVSKYRPAPPLKLSVFPSIVLELPCTYRPWEEVESPFPVETLSRTTLLKESAVSKIP